MGGHKQKLFLWIQTICLTYSLRMRINRLDLNLLACLDALLAHRNVSRAAKQMHLSQPATSAALARLRDYFQDPLLLREGRHYALTPFAESLIDPVRDILSRAQALTQLRPETDPLRMERNITIVASDYVFSTVLVPLFRMAETTAPRLTFAVRPVSGYDSPELENQHVDLVLLGASAVASHHPSELLLSDSFCCIAWAENPLIGRTLSLKAFQKMGHVVPLLGDGRLPTLDQVAYEMQGVVRRIAMRVPTFSAVAECVVGTSHIATIPKSFAKGLLKTLPLRLMTCPIHIPPVRIAMQWHRHQADDPVLRWVRRNLQDVAVQQGFLRPHSPS